MVFRQGSTAFPHDLSCDGLRRHLHRIHTTDEGLEPLVGEGRLTPVQLYDPEGHEQRQKGVITQTDAQITLQVYAKNDLII